MDAGPSMTKPAFDVAAIRAEFPILSREINGHPLAFLDTAASAQKPCSVIDAMSQFQATHYANVHRGVYTLANEATEAFERARESVRRFIGAASIESVVFTKGATEAINLVANTFGKSLSEGDEIILSIAEHHANIVPWHMLRQAKGVRLVWVEPDTEGELHASTVAAAVTPKTRLIALGHMSNVLGTRAPIEDVLAIAKAKGIPVLLDGCQGIVHEQIDVKALGVDFYVFSGHKLYGPTGIGVCYMAPQWAASLPPWQGGGEMIDRVTRDEVTWNDPPHKFEPGTPAIVEAVGLDAAIRFVEGLDREAVAAHEMALVDQAMKELSARNNVRVFGRARNKGPIITFALDGAHPHDVAQILDRRGVAIRAGHHCAQPLMEHLGVTATARASFGVYSTPEDVDRFIEALDLARRMLT
jgi:cysteine desulfurase / selenocysteine lyase